MDKKGKKKVSFITLGCKTNQYETNGMMQKFIEAGYKICNVDENPDIYIVNTCTVTNIADRKSRQSLRKIKKDSNTIIVAVGCYAQVAKDDLEQMPEIDIVLGNKEKKEIVKYVEEYLQNSKNLIKVDTESLKKEDENKIEVNLRNFQKGTDVEKKEPSPIKKDRPQLKIVDVGDISKQKEFDEYGCINYTEKSRTTIKIQDGCNNFCTYCLIPYARGRIRSRKKENIIKEAKSIAKQGIKEIVLTGIHIASYGKDFEEDYKLIDLLEDLNEVEGIERIRLGSLEPTIITEEFAKRLANLKKICNHFHLSLQSGCNETLKRMNRKYTVEQFRNVVNILRKNFENVNLTTDIIVGFPGETENEFNYTYNFLEEISFYKMHVFKYSKRTGTVAEKLPNQVDGNIAEDRSKKLIELSNKNQLRYNNSYIGKEVDVLFEEKQGDFWIGHTTNYMVVKMKADEDLENKIEKVMIRETNKEELFA